MALRTTSEKVKQILTKDYDSRRNPSLDPFIVTASATVDRLVTRATEIGISVPSTSFELVERWLAAHCYMLSEKGFAEQSTAGASAKYQGQTGMYLDATFYGQQAQMLDPTGLLGSLTRKSGASVTWLGKRASVQIPYDQRS